MTPLTLALWERRLFALAGEESSVDVASATSIRRGMTAPTDTALLDAAFAHCKAITAAHCRSLSGK